MPKIANKEFREQEMKLAIQWHLIIYAKNIPDACSDI